MCPISKTPKNSLTLTCHQCLTSLKLDLIGREASSRSEDQQEYYKEYRLSQKGIHLWRLIHQLYGYARNLCSIYDISFCRDESCCFMRYKHVAFQCEYNDDATSASYAKGNHDFYDVEQIEEFVSFKGA